MDPSETDGPEFTRTPIRPVTLRSFDCGVLVWAGTMYEGRGEADTAEDAVVDVAQALFDVVVVGHESADRSARLLQPPRPQHAHAPARPPRPPFRHLPRRAGHASPRTRRLFPRL